jgi:hypothetical protein
LGDLLKKLAILYVDIEEKKCFRFRFMAGDMWFVYDLSELGSVEEHVAEFVEFIRQIKY